MRSITVATIVVCGAFLTSVFAAPQAPDTKVSLDEQLRSFYPPVELSKDNLNVTKPGTILQVNRPKIGMLQNFLIFVNTYKDGQIKQAFVSKMMVPKGTDTEIHVGDKVYLDKIEVKPKGKEPSITFTIQACGNCDFTPVSSGLWRAAVAFQFAEGALDQPDIAKIRQTIGEVFTVVQPAAQQTAVNVQQPGVQPSPAQGPVNIQLGQTVDQVITVLGQPERKATVGPKEIYFYKDMKITFQNGTVADVQ